MGWASTAEVMDFLASAVGDGRRMSAGDLRELERHIELLMANLRTTLMVEDVFQKCEDHENPAPHKRQVTPLQLWRRPQQ